MKEKLYALIEKINAKMEKVIREDLNYFGALWDLKIAVLKFTAKMPFKQDNNNEVEIFIDRYNEIVSKYEKNNEKDM